MNISPLKTIPVSYVVLPTDLTLYYVQAVLRDTASGAILQTINLVQNATYQYRYTGVFKPVPDTSGLGRYVDITIIVYTDSAHTTPSQNYAALLVNYVVLQQWIPSLGAGGGGSIDYEKLRLMIAEMIAGSNKVSKSGFRKLSKKDVDYARIEAFTGNIVNVLKEELGSHHGQIKSQLDGHIGLMKASDIEKSTQMEKLFSGLDSSMKMLPKIHDTSMKELKKDIKEQLGMTEREFQKILGNSFKTLDKTFKDSSKESSESMKQYIADNLKEKEVKFHMNLGGSNKAPEEKDPNGVDMAEIMKLMT